MISNLSFKNGLFRCCDYAVAGLEMKHTEDYKTILVSNWKNSYDIH